jgi:hypothetical protein
MIVLDDFAGSILCCPECRNAALLELPPGWILRINGQLACACVQCGFVLIFDEDGGEYSPDRQEG